MSENVGDPYDINGANFNPDMYWWKIAKECRLREIMDNMDEIVATKAVLESDLQTLVYENYNKFISATDTIRKMKSDFRTMEDTLDSLETNMDSITSFSEQISSTLQRTRQQISRLSSVHALLKRLEFLFKLPNNLKILISQGNYRQAVRDYIHAQRVLQKYGNMPSFSGIQNDCEEIVEELKAKLRQEFHKRDATTKSLAESVDLLLRLREPTDSLCAEFLSYADNRLSDQLEVLKDMCENDLLEFMDVASSGFLGDLCLVVASYRDMFINREPLDKNEFSDDFDTKAITRLDTFVLGNMNKYFDLVRSRVDDVADTAILVRGLDRFYRRLQAMNMLCTERDFAKTATKLVINAGKKQCRNHLNSLKQHLNETLAKVRQTLATKVSHQDGDGGLAELEALLVMPTIEKVKGVLQDLLVFLQADLSFSLKPQFLQSFSVAQVREGLVVGFLDHLIETASGFCTGSDLPKFPPTLLLLLSKMCVEFKESGVRYLLTTTDDSFNVQQYITSKNVVTSESTICENFQKAAQNLLNHYVRLQGLSVSQMLRKSVETRDWLHTIEPRTVRAVMKRVVEDVTAIESQVAALYADVDAQIDRSSDSSRKTHSVSISRHQYRSNWSSYTSSHLDSSLVTNIHKLFSERIEIFSSVQFNKASILTGIVKISLKTFLECVRLRTFSKYGLQQIQVDTHYLQLYLWRFVTDEKYAPSMRQSNGRRAYNRNVVPTSQFQRSVKLHNLNMKVQNELEVCMQLLVSKHRAVTISSPANPQVCTVLVHFLLDEILGSAVHRCLEPVLMEPSVVDIICERQ